ncbi:MAG TPA: hypothetical protein VFP54_10140 [Acidimicrobiales bacterium]|nr:hypothetical protein [Acidimicrobiales bacterium]
MTLTQDHRVTIERRGRSHKCVCSCGWTSHSWNELRPAEADAWHHVFGDDVIVDVSSIPDERSVPAGSGPRPGGVGPSAGRPADGGDRAVEQLVRQARELADRPSPYTRGAAAELWRQAGEDPVLVQAAITELVELLARHDRRSAGAADSEWLQLITARRLLAEAAAVDDTPGGRRGRRALI